MMGPDAAAMFGMDGLPQDEKMFVATVPDKVAGAGVIAYQNFMDEAAERVGGDFFILPSSTHEVLLVKDDGEANFRDLKAMVEEVNATQVALEEKLTDSVYHYDSKEHIFELAEKFEARQQAKEAEISSEKEEKDSVLGDLKAKKEELATIVEATSQEEEKLRADRDACAAKIDERTMSAYDHIRQSCKNHLAVVSVFNGDSCGGCFNTIAPQRLIDIAANKKMIVCEYCGRILVNPDFE